jgi:uncharacterized GH25 family protein
MKIKIVLLLVALSSVIASAHEFWLEPERFQGDDSVNTIPIQIKVGMEFAGKIWGGDLDKITELAVYHGDEKRSLIEDGKPEQPIVPVEVDEPGQYLIGFTNESSFIELKPDEFEKYVISEGLESIVEQRAKMGESDKVGTELYKRCAKTLLQIGPTPTTQTYSRTFGFPLELTPQQDPYSESTENMTFVLTYDGKPLEGVKVMVWRQTADKLEKSALRTDSRGEVNFPLEQTGKWMTSVVHMVRTDGSDKADWQSYWGSYTFGFSEKP